MLIGEQRVAVLIERASPPARINRADASTAPLDRPASGNFFATSAASLPLCIYAVHLYPELEPDARVQSLPRRGLARLQPLRRAGAWDAMLALLLDVEEQVRHEVDEQAHARMRRTLGG